MKKYLCGQCIADLAMVNPYPDNVDIIAVEMDECENYKVYDEERDLATSVAEGDTHAEDN